MSDRSRSSLLEHVLEQAKVFGQFLSGVRGGWVSLVALAPALTWPLQLCIVLLF
jgi:hypothetical protein